MSETEHEPEDVESGSPDDIVSIVVRYPRNVIGYVWHGVLFTHEDLAPAYSHEVVTEGEVVTFVRVPRSQAENMVAFTGGEVLP